MDFKLLRQEVWWANVQLPQAGLVTMHSGNASGVDRDSGLVLGLPFINHPATPNTGPLGAFGSALDLGVLLASFSVTSPHTIHPDASMSNLLDFAGDLGLSEKPLKGFGRGSS